MSEHEQGRTWPLPFGERAELDVTSDLGSLTLLPVAPGAEPRVEVSGRDVNRIDVTVDRDGNTVRVRVRRRPSMRHWFGSWDGATVVHVPRDVRARLHTDLGSIEARDLGPCDLRISTDAGRIAVEDVTGRLRLAAAAGKISGRRLAGSLDAETDAGAISLAIERLDPGEHRVRADAGSVTIALAPGLDVRVETSAGLGSVRNEYPSHPDAPALLRAATDLGSVRVHEARADDDADERLHDDSGVRVHAGVFGPDWERQFKDKFAGAWTTPPAPPPPPAPPFRSERAEEAGAGTPGDRPAGRGQAVNPEVERILKMVEAGELSARDADELLRAINHE